MRLRVVFEWLSPETSGIFLGADGGRVAPTSLTRRGVGKLRLERQFCFETKGGAIGTGIRTVTELIIETGVLPVLTNKFG
eukprot:COSAG02_NODE_2387_length_8986_cov_12.395184_8_plen_80_part_00